MKVAKQLRFIQNNALYSFDYQFFMSFTKNLHFDIYDLIYQNSHAKNASIKSFEKDANFKNDDFE